MVNRDNEFWTELETINKATWKTIKQEVAVIECIIEKDNSQKFNRICVKGGSDLTDLTDLIVVGEAINIRDVLEIKYVSVNLNSQIACTSAKRNRYVRKKWKSWLFLKQLIGANQKKLKLIMFDLLSKNSIKVYNQLILIMHHLSSKNVIMA